MQQRSTQSEGCLGIPEKQKESLKPPDTTANCASHDEPKRELLMVTQEAVEAYEKRTGFYGIGRIIVEDWHWIIVTKEERIRSRAREHTNRSMMSRQGGIA